nr:hypothetical protein [Streptomyces sp. SID5468]
MPRPTRAPAERRAKGTSARRWLRRERTSGPEEAPAGAVRRFLAREGVRRRECAKGINDVEGYLLWQAEAASAAAGAEVFADRLPWLTSAQREEVVRVYTDDRLELSRAVLERIADRARSLQREYGERYRLLRIRLLGGYLAAAAGAAAVLLALGRPGHP